MWRTTYNTFRRLRDMTLLRHARDFKFCMSQAQWCVKIALVFNVSFLKSVLYYMLHFSSFSLGNRVFRRFLKFFFLRESLRTSVAFLFLKFDCLIFEMFFIRDLKPKLNKQRDSIRAKLFV